MKVTVTGTMKGQNKAGREFFQIYATTPFTDYESQNNECIGLKTVDVFTYLDCSTLRVGDVVDLVYEPGFQGRATLTDIIPIKNAETSAAKPAEKVSTAK